MRSILCLTLSLLVGSCLANCFSWNGKPEVVGKLQFYATKPGESVADVARKFDIGYDNLLQANPGISPDMPSDEVFVPVAGTMFVVPTKFLIPKFRKSSGILINLPAKNLYYFNKPRQQVCIHPIGVGKEDWNTPTGKLFIMQKIKHPVWIVPKSIYEFRKKRGDPVPKIMQSGPDNPLGDFALRLSEPTYLIHGTNEPEGVGRRSSAGCIRMFPEDIAKLFTKVGVKTPVIITHMPVNLQKINDEWYVQWRLPLEQTDDANMQDMLQAKFAKLSGGGNHPVHGAHDFDLKHSNLPLVRLGLVRHLLTH